MYKAPFIAITFFYSVVSDDTSKYILIKRSVPIITIISSKYIILVIKWKKKKRTRYMNNKPIIVHCQFSERKKKKKEKFHNLYNMYYFRIIISQLKQFVTRIVNPLKHI